MEQRKEVKDIMKVPPLLASSAKERRAHREVNRLLVGAGLILAGAGIPRHAPEMKALSAALRAVNRAGGIEGPAVAGMAEKEMIGAHSPSQARRFRRAAL